jgi:MFS family permease
MNLASLRATLDDRFRALRHRNFRLFWYGQLVSLVGTWMQSVAQGWLMHRLTDSPMMLGLLAFCQFLPVTLLSVWAGVIADRVDKRRMLLFTQTASLIQAVVFAVLTSTGHIEPWMVLMLALGFGVINAFDLPGRQSILAELVGREDLSNAIALSSAGFNTARILGPAIAGGVLVLIGESGCFWVNAASYLAVIAGLLLMRLERIEARAQAALSSLKEGVRYAIGTRPIRNLLMLLAICAGLGFQYNTLLPVYARSIFHSDSQTYGWMMSAFGLGSLTSAILMTRKLDRWDLRRNLLVGLTSAGLGQALFAWSRWLPLTYLMGFVSGFGLILYVASTNVLVQMTTEDRFRGRVMSFYTLVFVGTAPFGALLAGSLAERFGAPVATSVCALILLGGALWIVRRLRLLRAEEAARAAQVPMVEKIG